MMLEHQRMQERITHLEREAKPELLATARHQVTMLENEKLKCIEENELLEREVVRNI